MKAGSFLYLPELRFESETAQWRIGGMANDGSDGSSSFTFVRAEPLGGGPPVDQWQLLPGVRDMLSDAGQRGITVKIADGVVRVHRDGIAGSKAELDDMIDIAEFVVTTCVRMV